MGLEGYFWLLNEPFTDAKQFELSPHFHICFFKIFANRFLPSASGTSKWITSFKFRD